jgi:endonuclease/exonuclease/phosphatase family metal-dependent hydrolase
MEVEMSNVIRVSMAAAGRFGAIALLLIGGCVTGQGADSEKKKLTVMTRNMDNGTDLGYIFAATHEKSYAYGMQATWDEIHRSNFKQRAARLAEEIEEAAPELIALQEVTLWRVGPLLSPPATGVLYDQLDLLLAELAKRKLSYGVVAVQVEVDAEAPVPTVGVDLRMTDRDVILARQDLPSSLFRVLSAHSQQYAAMLQLGNPVLGQIPVPCGWLVADVVVDGVKLRFVNTHLQAAIPGVPEAEQAQHQQGQGTAG